MLRHAALLARSGSRIAFWPLLIIDSFSHRIARWLPIESTISDALQERRSPLTIAQDTRKRTTAVMVRLWHQHSLQSHAQEMSFSVVGRHAGTLLFGLRVDAPWRQSTAPQSTAPMMDWTGSREFS